MTVSVKSLQKQLIAAVAMVLVAMIALGSSTYAWFANNTKVTAETMSVKATTGPNLYIATGASVAIDSITGTAVDDLAVSNLAISPAHMSDSSGTVTVQNADTYDTAPTVDSAGKAATYTTIGTLTDTTPTNEGSYDLKNYCASGFVTIARKQTATGGTYTLTPKCTITFGTESQLNKCIRAGVIINGKLYESNDANAASGTNVEFTFSDIAGLKDNTAYSACLIVWFEGEDEHCFSNNAVVVSQNSASWEFTAV